MPASSRQENTSVLRSRVEVFPQQQGGYAESQFQAMEFSRWSTLTFEFPPGVCPGGIRMGLADLPCIIELAEISIKDAQSGVCVWAAREMTDLRKLAFSTTASLLPFADRCWLLSHANDPSVHLPRLPANAGVVQVEISLRLERSFDRLCDALRASVHGFDKSMQQLAATKEIEAAELRAELRNSQSERMLVAAELRQVVADRNYFRSEKERAEQALESAGKKLAEFASLRKELESLRAESDSLHSSLENEKAARISMENSRSWRLTRPLRAFLKEAKKKP